MGFVLFCMAAPTLYFIYKYIVKRDEEIAERAAMEHKKEESENKEVA